MYDQHIPQSQTADQPTAPRGRDTTRADSTKQNRLNENVSAVLTFSLKCDNSRHVFIASVHENC